MNLEKEVEIARELAMSAGEALMRYRAAPLRVDWKPDGDPVTPADRAASTLLVQQLRSRFPGDAILSEEEPDDPARFQSSRLWVIDPMDGTREFLAHRDEFAVMLGLALEGAPVLGIVYNPAKKLLYCAARGAGATLTNEQGTIALHVSPEADPRRMKIALSRTHPSTAVEEVCRRLGIAQAVVCGSIGLKIGLLCEGRAHLYLDLSGKTSQWDTCAPSALLLEAGGRITDGNGGPLRYGAGELRHHNGVIASTGVIHERVVEAARLDRTRTL